MNISIYSNVKQTESKEFTTILEFLSDIKEGKWQDAVLKIRTIQDKEIRRAEKTKLPNVTISGVFGKRIDTDCKVHSGLIAIDLDDLNSEVESTRVLLEQDPYIFSLFASCSGNGLCVIFKINPEKHRDSFEAIADYFIRKYQLLIDSTGINESRARFVSYDPDLYVNDKCLTFKKYLPKPKKKSIPITIFVQSEFDEVVNKMVNQGVSCVEDYRDWRDIGFGLADQFGEAGRQYFHSLSSVSSKYDPTICDKQYTQSLQRNGRPGNKITIATIYWHAKQAGINTTSERTKKIASATSSMKKSGLDAKTIATNLEKFEGITGVDDIIQQAFANDTNEAAPLVDRLRMHLKHHYKLKRNVITRKLENDGKILDEIHLNTMYLDCLIMFDKLTFELFCKVLFSNNTIDYNPLHDWFNANKENNHEGVIDAFFGCFETKDEIKYFGKKWLVSIIASAYGNHSPLMLIFAGEKQGTGKTEAFRRLLPAELRSYYAEMSPGMKDTDFNLMLTQKLIVMDDECGGKSKKDALHLKSMLSKQTFTLREPYGKMNVDLDRLAVLCGTTNDLEILNDPTGNRRLIPIEITGVNIVSMNAINKTSLIMEAWHLYKSGYDWQLSREDIDRLATNTDKFQEVSLENEMLQKFFTHSTDYFLTTSEVKNILETKTVQKYSLRRIGMELKRLKFERVKRSGNYVYLIEEKDKLKGSFIPNGSGITF